MATTSSEPGNPAHLASGPGSLATQELLRRVSAGDTGARNELLAYCYPRVMRLVQARLGTKLRATCDPSDIVNDTMAEACKRLADLEIQELGQLINWLGKVAYHRITGVARDLYKVPQVLGALATSSTASCPQVADRSSILSPSSDVAQQEEIARVMDALDCLPPDQRQVIYLRNFAEASWAFIAREMDFEGPSGACMLHTRAWAALSASLGNPAGGK